ncbi:hypothetical protein HmCmsJML041_02929 [Escherichia coli]|nr:hypothetical protein HmCmsJML041_02929 [Escherichia coli]
MRIVQPGKTEQAFRHTDNLLQGTVKGGQNLHSKRPVAPGAACANGAQGTNVALLPAPRPADPSHPGPPPPPARRSRRRCAAV